MRINLFSQSSLQNATWIIASLGLAIVIWIAANMAENPVEQNEIGNVAVEVKLPEGYVVTARSESTTVTAVVRAPAKDWDLLVPGDVLVTADLRDIKEPGPYRIELEAEVAAPLHGSVIAIRPSTWTLTIDRRTEARLPVNVIVTERPPLGYTFSRDFDCDTTEVVVSGSSEAVGEVAGVEARLDLSDALTPVTRTVNLTPVQDNGFRAREVDLLPTTVTCDVAVQISEGVTPVEVLPDRSSTTPPAGYTFQGYSSIEPRRVGLTGDQEAITALNSVVRTARIDLTDKTETFTTEVPLVLPDNVSLVEGDLLVRVTVIITPVFDSREFAEIPVEIIGLNETLYRATGLPATVTVNITGPQAHLPDLNAENIRVVVDLSTLDPGVHQIMPDATIIGQTEQSEFSISSVLPEVFNVTLEALNPTPTPSSTVFPTFPRGGS